MKQKPKNSLSAEKEIAIVKAVHQKTAAFFAGIPISTLRDNSHAITPDEDGRFDLRDVADWKQDRAADLSDDDYEKMLRVIEAASFFFHNASHTVDYLEALIKKYGNSFCRLFTELLLDDAKKFGNDEPVQRRKPTNAEFLAMGKAQFREESFDIGKARLEIATVCHSCGKVRHGKKWVKRKPAANHEIEHSVCPACPES